MAKSQINPQYAKRLKTVIDIIGLSVPKLTESIGYKEPQTIYHVLKGRQNMSESLMLAIANKYPNISFIYLKDGEGEPQLDVKMQYAQMNLLGTDNEVSKEDKIIAYLIRIDEKLNQLLERK